MTTASKRSKLILNVKGKEALLLILFQFQDIQINEVFERFQSRLFFGVKHLVMILDLDTQAITADTLLLFEHAARNES